MLHFACLWMHPTGSVLCIPDCVCRFFFFWGGGGGGGLFCWFFGGVIVYVGTCLYMHF